MSDRDRDKWNRRYTDPSHAPGEPSRLLVDLQRFLPKTGRALDLAGGSGRHAIWLAQQGLQVTLADISRQALAIARQRAEQANVEIGAIEIDLDCDSIPTGPWDLILTFFYLCRPLFRRFPSVMSPTGRLIVVQPTLSNLQRHAKPPAEFLLDDGELPNLVEGLEILHYQEGWSVEGRHDAIIICQQLS